MSSIDIKYQQKKIGSLFFSTVFAISKPQISSPEACILICSKCKRKQESSEFRRKKDSFELKRHVATVSWLLLGAFIRPYAMVLDAEGTGPNHLRVQLRILQKFEFAFLTNLI